MQFSPTRKERIQLVSSKFSGSMQTEANSQDFTVKKMESMHPSVSFEDLYQQTYQEESKACARYLFASKLDRIQQLNNLAKLYQQKVAIHHDTPTNSSSTTNHTPSQTEILEYFLQKWLIGMDYMSSPHKKYIIGRLSLHFHPSSTQMSISLKAYDRLRWAGMDDGTRIAWLQQICKNGWEWWIGDICKKITLQSNAIH